MSIAVRPAKDDDADWIVSHLPALSKFYATSQPLYEDPCHARDGVLGLIRNHFTRIALLDDVRAGFISGLVTDHPLNPNVRTLTEILWWVPDGPSRARIGMALLDEFVDWGRRHTDWIFFSLKAANPIGANALMRRGFTAKETIYLLECE